MSNETSNAFSDNKIAYFRQPPLQLTLFCVFYGLVLVVGLVGNLFVVIAVFSDRKMSSITNYFITNLAVADLLIIIFCLPFTLMNNLLTEWHLGNLLCGISMWISGMTSCTSVYTLVAVTADRYFAICHPFLYTRWEEGDTCWVIVPIWLISSLLFAPWFIYFDRVVHQLPSTSIVLCMSTFPNQLVERLFFVIVNFCIAFLIPLMLITSLYTAIFRSVLRRSINVHIDTVADQRVRVRVAKMMLLVVILFGGSWLPLYILFVYLYFGADPAPFTVTQVTSIWRRTTPTTVEIIQEGSPTMVNLSTLNRKNGEFGQSICKKDRPDERDLLETKIQVNSNVNLRQNTDFEQQTSCVNR